MPAQRTVLELCVGGGGQAIGLEAAGFHTTAAVDIEKACTETLRRNRPRWRVVTADIREVDGHDYRGVDVVAGGVPCSPFSVAGQQFGAQDERDLFPEALRIVDEVRPRAGVILENVPALASSRFTDYRVQVLLTLERLGYVPAWKILNASAFGVPQLRPRFVLVALRRPYFANWVWPVAHRTPPTVGQTLEDLMAERGWPGAHDWARNAGGVAPTIVGGSTKHGGPDLGPTRAREAWRALGVDGRGVADEAPGPEVRAGHSPKLTVRMVARIQGFPDSWQFAGTKTARYRQIGNAFPPPVAAAVGESVRMALAAGHRSAQRDTERNVRMSRTPAATVQEPLFLRIRAGDERCRHESASIQVRAHRTISRACMRIGSTCGSHGRRSSSQSYSPTVIGQGGWCLLPSKERPTTLRGGLRGR